MSLRGSQMSECVVMLFKCLRGSQTSWSCCFNVYAAVRRLKSWTSLNVYAAVSCQNACSCCPNVYAAVRRHGHVVSMFTWQPDVTKRDQAVLIFTRRSDVRKAVHSDPVFTRQSDVGKRGRVIPLLSRQSDVKNVEKSASNIPHTCNIFILTNMIVIQNVKQIEHCLNGLR